MKCGLCGGDKQLLGKLGAWKHYRCRSCGMVFSVAPKTKKAKGVK